MQRRKILARIIILILSVINFVLAVPVLERGIREVRVVVDVAEDVTTASQMRWNPSDNSHPLPVTRQTQHKDLLLDTDSISPSEPSTEPTDVDSTDSGSYHSSSPTGPMSPWSEYEAWAISKSSSSSPSHGASTLDVPTGPMSPWSEYEAWAISKSSTSSPSHDSSTLDVPNPFYHLPHPVQGDPPSPATLSDSGPPRLYSSSDSGPAKSDPGPRKRPYSPPDSGLPQSGPGPSKRPSYSSSERTQTDPGLLIGPYYPSAHAPPDPAPPTGPSDSAQSTGVHPPSGPGPSTPHPLSPGSLQQESENVISELFKDGRVKRRISGSRSVNAAQRDTLDSSDSTTEGSDKILDATAIL